MQPCAVVPTAGGKTPIMASICRDAVARWQGRVLILAHVKELLEQMSAALSAGERIEVRGFGSFSLHYRPPRMGRNPKTGDSVEVPHKHVPHFKPGKELRERVDL